MRGTSIAVVLVPPVPMDIPATQGQIAAAWFATSLFAKPPHAQTTPKTEMKPISTVGVPVRLVARTIKPVPVMPTVKAETVQTTSVRHQRATIQRRTERKQTSTAEDSVPANVKTSRAATSPPTAPARPVPKRPVSLQSA